LVTIIIVVLCSLFFLIVSKAVQLKRGKTIRLFWEHIKFTPGLLAVIWLLDSSDPTIYILDFYME
jgi:hypothetical protein